MAKAHPRSTTLDQVQSLLTSAERKVLQSSTASAIASATRDQLEAAMRRARALRDKWRDLHAAQTRSTKRSAASGGKANQRTADKHAVFADAVGRLEARLAAMPGGVAAAVRGAAGRRSTTPSKKVRAAASRSARAGVRAKLATEVAALNSRPVAAPKGRPAVVSNAAAKSTKTAPAAAPVAATGSAARRGTGKRKKPAAPAAASAQRGLSTAAGGQRAAKTAAKAARLKLEGGKTRRRGHVVASTKRAQARRDGRR